MSILQILKYPNPVLRKKSGAITAFDNDLESLAKDMVETMYNAPGVGLAAPQVGKSVQVIVIDVSCDEDNRNHMVMINPEITESEGSQFCEEGCLSVVDMMSNVERKKKIRVTFLDIKGEQHEVEAEDRMAIILQHEIDHLHGILFIDHLSPLKRHLYKKKLKKALALT